MSHFFELFNKLFGFSPLTFVKSTKDQEIYSSFPVTEKRTPLYTPSGFAS